MMASIGPVLDFRRYTRIGALLCVLAAPTWALDEVHVYGIAKFNGKGQCSGFDSHSVHTETANAFAAPFQFLQLFGKWDKVDTLNNSKARGSYWTDASKAGACSCTADDDKADAGADAANVIYVHTHGGHKLSSKEPHSYLVMGTSSYDCKVRTDQNMQWNSNLEIAVIKACEGGDYEVWKNGGYKKFLTTASEFQMWNAFHGETSCGSKVTAYVTNYAWESAEDGVGENWLDEAYEVNSGSNDDDCPVSIVFGESSKKRREFFEHGGWRNRMDTGEKKWSSYYYFAGCDPSKGIALPSD